MGRIVDTRGLTCPQPVILTKKALEQEDELTVIVDNAAAEENVRRMGTKSGCTVDIEEKNTGEFHIHLSRIHPKSPEAEGKSSTFSPECSAAARTLVVVLSSDRMGHGNDELGEVLIRSFIHTLLTLEPLPDMLIFYNTGVKLTVKDSKVLDDLRKIEGAGVSIFVCGTCLNYFGITKDIAVGEISNMYDIASRMAKAGKLVTP
jgi:selenium metabolism protein YedF